jgi:hypothetical protein
MTRGDVLMGKPTMYKGILFRSIFETKIAFFLDLKNIKWKYEPQVFRLSNGDLYKPDFFLPELKMWLEGKGVIEEHNREISKIFVEEYKQHLVLLSYGEVYYYGNDLDGEDYENNPVYEDNVAYLGFCTECNHWFFSSSYGVYNCKNCNFHDGDKLLNAELINEFKKLV